MFSKTEKEVAQRKQDPKKTKVQTKVKVGPPNDKYEQEADAVADKVMGMPAPKNPGPIQRKCAACENEEAQTKPLASLITPLVQRMSSDEEEPQAKPIQRMAPDDEEPQTKQIQKQDEEKEEPAQAKLQRQPNEEEEPVQGKPIQRMAPDEEEPQAKAIQRMSPDEEEPQTKRIQKQDEEKEEPAQAKPIQRMAPEEEEPQAKPIQRKSGQAGSSLESRLNASKGGGNPLPDETRGFMESRFGTDFSGVRVHTDNQAVQMNKELNSQAFAHGSDVYFNQGKYDTSSSSGKHLLAHELTHTVQQKKK